MTQALNLANFANKLNTSGQADNTSLQSGTYAISISGNAATATTATSATSATSATTATNATNVTGTVGSSVTGTTQSIGDNSTKIATTAYVQNMGLGWGQTWQNVTSSRALSTNYTNSTGKPIQVIVSLDFPSLGGQSGSAVVDGVTVAYSAINVVPNGGGSSSMSFIVPPGSVYSASCSATLSQWVELR